MIKEYSAGIILFDLKQKKVFLVQQKHGEHWGFCKGHIEKNEDILQAAKRELYEEGGLIADKRLCDEIFHEEYQFFCNNKLIAKDVAYFVYSADEIDFSICRDEILKAGWFTVEKAMKLITFEQTRNILLNIVVLLSKEFEL